MTFCLEALKGSLGIRTKNSSRYLILIDIKTTQSQTPLKVSYRLTRITK